MPRLRRKISSPIWNWSSYRTRKPPEQSRSCKVKWPRWKSRWRAKMKVENSLSTYRRCTSKLKSRLLASCGSLRSLNSSRSRECNRKSVGLKKARDLHARRSCRAIYGACSSCSCSTRRATKNNSSRFKGSKPSAPSRDQNLNLNCQRLRPFKTLSQIERQK